MKVQVFNSKASETFKPEPKSIIIRITSNEEFAIMEHRNLFQDVLELRFDDISDTHPKEDTMLYGAMTQEHYQQIKSFMDKNIDSFQLSVHCIG